MVRLLLALLIALLPMPSAAAPACHEAPMAVEANANHHRPAQPEPAKTQLPADQLCIGCVAPATARPPAFREPAPVARIEIRAPEIAGVARAATPPATPPPRLPA
jgi:hypothetical protein